MSAPLELLPLLNKCHRDELVPLARLLSIREAKLGLKDLARAIERRLRWEGGHAFRNVLRGEGPTYEEVLEQLLVALKLPVLTRDVQAQEAAVVRDWLGRNWDAMSEGEREPLWQAFSPGQPAMPDGKEATRRAALVLGRDFEFRSTALAAFSVTGLSLFGLLARPLLPFVMAAGMLKAMGPRMAVVVPAVVQVAMLRLQVRHRVTIGFVGSPSSGKDAAIRALLGIDSGNINPVAGSTRQVAVQHVPGTLALFVVNTPGMGDVVKSVTEEARQVLDHIDVYVYVLNAEGGVQARELADYQACVATGKPTLVTLNKIDVLRERDRERYIADARQKLGGESVQLMTCAFDPLPQISERAIGLEPVHAWMASQLVALGKDPEELPALPD